MSAATIVAPAAPAKPWISSDQVLKIVVGIYLALFFLYLFLKLSIISASLSLGHRPESSVICVRRLR